MDDQRYIRISRRLLERLSASPSSDRDGRKKRLRAALLDRLAARGRKLEEFQKPEAENDGASRRL